MLKQHLSFFLVFILACGCIPAHAKQAISESLVDCAAIYTMSTRAFPERHTAKTAALKHANKTLTASAQERAILEGRLQADKFIEVLTREKQQKWDAKGVQFIFSEEFKGSTAYCRSLAKHLNIRLKSD